MRVADIASPAGRSLGFPSSSLPLNIVQTIKAIPARLWIWVPSKDLNFDAKSVLIQRMVKNPLIKAFFRGAQLSKMKAYPWAKSFFRLCTCQNTSPTCFKSIVLLYSTCTAPLLLVQQILCQYKRRSLVQYFIQFNTRKHSIFNSRHNSVPVREILSRQGLNIPVSCPL